MKKESGNNMLKIDNDKLLKNTGLSFETMEDMFFYIKSHIEWLESHNKNYNNNQYHRLLDLKDIFDCIEVE